MVVLLISACGGSGRLSASEYRAHLRTVAKESDAAQHAVEKGFRATSAPHLVKVLTVFGTAQKRIGDEVAALKPPKDADGANTELATGLHDTDSEVKAVLPKLERTVEYVVRTVEYVVIPAQAGIQFRRKDNLGPGLRRGDEHARDVPDLWLIDPPPLSLLLRRRSAVMNPRKARGLASRTDG